MIDKAEKRLYNWIKFEEFWEFEGIGLEHEDDYMASWICWVRGYTQAVEDMGRRGKDIKLEDRQ